MTDNVEREEIMLIARQIAKASEKIRVKLYNTEEDDMYSQGMFRAAGSFLDLAAQALVDWHENTKPDWTKASAGVIREWGFDELVDNGRI